MNKDSIIDLLGFLTLKFLGFVFLYIPLKIALFAGKIIGDTAYHLNPKRRAIAYANVKAAFRDKQPDEMRKIVRRHFRNLGINVIEIFRMPKMNKRYMDTKMTVKGIENLERVLNEKRGVIFLTAHFGNWELAPLLVSHKGYNLNVFAREQKHPRLNGILNRYRWMTGSRVVSKGSVREIIKILRSGDLVAMLSDQDAGANGVFVDFFGRPASTAPGVVSFGINTGAAILPAFIIREGAGRHRIEILKEIKPGSEGSKEEKIKKVLSDANRITESFITKHPEQWLWSHKRWKSTPVRKVVILTDGKKGHFNQSMAVAETVEKALISRLSSRDISEKARADVETAEVKFRNRFTRFLLCLTSLFAGSRCQGCLKCLKFCLKKESYEKIKNLYADIVISCGASTVSTNVFFKYENNARNAVIMKPGWGRSGKFDLVILPEHDRPSRVKPNMLITEMVPTPARYAENKTVGEDGIGLLIGGDTRNFRMDKTDIAEITDQVLRAAEKRNLKIYATTSRRTPGEVSSVLKEKLAGNRMCGMLVIVSDNDKKGAMNDIFASCGLIIVSPDSTSMISEAVDSGRHVIVFNRGHHPERKSKYMKFISYLRGRGYIHTAGSGEVAAKIDTVLAEKPGIKRPEDRQKITRRVKSIL